MLDLARGYPPYREEHCAAFSPISLGISTPDNSSKRRPFFERELHALCVIYERAIIFPLWGNSPSFIPTQLGLTANTSFAWLSAVCFLVLAFSPLQNDGRPNNCCTKMSAFSGFDFRGRIELFCARPRGWLCHMLAKLKRGWQPAICQKSQICEQTKRGYFVFKSAFLADRAMFFFLTEVRLRVSKRKKVGSWVSVNYGQSFWAKQRERGSF